MSNFVSFAIGQVDTPVNIIKEFLAKFSKRQKCKAAILSWLDGQHFYGHEWIRATLEEIAKILGYHRDTISRHLNELRSLDIVSAVPANKFPKDTAFQYQINTNKLLEFVGIKRCGKTDIDMPDNQHLSAENPATFINQIQNNLNNFSLEKEGESVKKAKSEDAIGKQESNQKSQTENLDPSGDKSSAACSEVPKKRKVGAESNSDLNFSRRRTKQQESSLQEVWEIAPGHPYPVFLNWRADKHYKPQGGKWESDAYGIAYSEFYKNRSKTTVVLFPQFLEYMKTCSENCNQQVANGIKAILPSCFIARPEATQENVQQLMANIQQLVDSGVEVALPNPGAPSSTQSMSFVAAAKSGIIEPLPILEQPTLAAAEDSGHKQVAQALVFDGMRKIFKTQLHWEVDDERFQWFSKIQQPERSHFWNKLKAACKKGLEPVQRAFDRLRVEAQEIEEEKEVQRAIAHCWLLAGGFA